MTLLGRGARVAVNRPEEPPEHIHVYRFSEMPIESDLQGSRLVAVLAEARQRWDKTTKVGLAGADCFDKQAEVYKKAATTCK